MKRHLAFLLASLCMIAAALCAPTHLEEEKLVRFHDRMYDEKTLSEETVQWLDWYNDLTAEEQLSISAVPPELIGAWETIETEEANPWGITLSAKNVMRGGVTIVCTQSGGAPTGELSTGAPYWLEELTENGWEVMETKPKELAWTAEGWIISMEDTVEWEVRWARLYGSLDDGIYRIGKSIMDWRAPGDYDTQSVYAQFTIGS